MDPHFSCSNYAFKNRTCSKKSQNKPSNLSFKKTVNDVDNQWHLVLRYVNLVISENGRRCKAIPRMRGTLIKLLVHALRASSRATKNNWFQKARAKKSPHGKTMWAWVTTSFVVRHPKGFYSKRILGAVRCCVAFCLFHFHRFRLCVEYLGHRFCEI
jgi:hypothetical protein